MTSSAAPSQLLLVSLGPIQDFIASARRCQDLWYGSWLLSDLARAVAQSLQARAGTTLVFPGALGNDKPSVANKVLAVLGGDAEAAARDAEAAMRSRLGEIAQEAFAAIADEPLFHRDVAHKQLEDLIEYHWVTVPVDGEHGYAAAREAAEAALASVKRSRTWGPVSWTDGQPGVPKSSLDGLRESVIDEQLYDLVARGERSAEWARRTFGVRSAERLCGVGLLKRRGVDLAPDAAERRRHPPFHSTAHVASAPLLLRMSSVAGAEAAFTDYCNELRDLGLDLSRFHIRPGSTRTATFTSPFGGPLVQAPRTFGRELQLDGQLLFESRLETILDEQSDGSANEKPRARAGRLEQARRALRRFLGVVGTPPPYYALLLADGDAMGATIDRLAKSGGLEAHRRLSGALERFAQGAATIVAEHGGSLIYSGGDDVLAMVPLHGALPCARALHDAFGRAVEEPAKSLGAGEARPTLSVGVAVVHHLEPFGEARERAREAEARAKAHPGKDALAFTVVPRSGAETTVVESWSRNPDRTLANWVVLFARDEVSRKAPHDLMEALDPLRVGLTDQARAALGPVVESLARRVVAAKRRSGGGEGLATYVREQLHRRFSGPADPFSEVSRLVDELLVAQALLPGYLAAFGAPQPAAPPRGTSSSAGEVRP